MSLRMKKMSFKITQNRENKKHEFMEKTRIYGPAGIPGISTWKLKIYPRESWEWLYFGFFRLLTFPLPRPRNIYCEAYYSVTYCYRPGFSLVSVLTLPVMIGCR